MKHHDINPILPRFLLLPSLNRVREKTRQHQAQFAEDPQCAKDPQDLDLSEKRTALLSLKT